MPKGDFIVQSKHSDVSLDHPDGGWSEWWFDTPTKGKCLSVEYTPFNYPCLLVGVGVCSNTKCWREISHAKKNGWQHASTPR